VSDIVIKDRRFWRRKPDGTLVPLQAPRSTGLASKTFASTGNNLKNRKARK